MSPREEPVAGAAAASDDGTFLLLLRRLVARRSVGQGDADPGALRAYLGGEVAPLLGRLGFGAVAVRASRGEVLRATRLDPELTAKAAGVVRDQQARVPTPLPPGHDDPLGRALTGTSHPRRQQSVML